MTRVQKDTTRPHLRTAVLADPTVYRQHVMYGHCMLTKWFSGKRVPPVALTLGAGVTQAVLAGRVRRSWISGAVAGALTVASAGFLLSSVTAFRRAGTTVDPLVVERAESLVTTGVFRLTRNPMYLGMAGLLLAHAALRRSWVACIPAGAFVAVIDRTQIPAEEQALRKRFGRAFDDFARSTPRWLDSRSIRSLR